MEPKAAEATKETDGPRGRSQGKKGAQTPSIQDFQWTESRPQSLELVLALFNPPADTEQLPGLSQKMMGWEGRSGHSQS